MPTMTIEPEVASSGSSPSNVSGQDMLTTASSHNNNQVRRVFWNAKKRELWGKALNDWVKLVLFYSTFYSFIALLWLLMFVIFYQTVDQRSPTLRYGENAIGYTPGLSIRPRPPPQTPHSTLIYFSSTDRGTYRHYVDDLQAFLDTYIDVKHGSDIAGKCLMIVG